MTKPHSLITLTGLAGGFTKVSRPITEMVRALRTKDGLTFQWAYAVEPNPNGRGYHAHGLQHGDVVDPRLLAQRAQEVGLGAQVDIRKVRTKEVYGYPMKMVTWPDHQETYLAVNGGRLLHTTRGYWRDGETGEAITGGVAAVSRLIRARDRKQGKG